MARVRLPQTSLMRSGSCSVPQAPSVPSSFKEETAAESHPDPMWSPQRVGSTISLVARPYLSSSVFGSHIRATSYDSTQDRSLRFGLFKIVATLGPNQCRLKPSPCAEYRSRNSGKESLACSRLDRVFQYWMRLALERLQFALRAQNVATVVRFLLLL